MARKFEELRAKMSPERRHRNEEETAKQLLDLTLQELRQNVAHLNQDDLAEILKVTQGYVSRLERQDDMLLSNLYAYVSALGGEVEIRAKFPDQEVRITQFKEIEKLKAALAPRSKQKKSA
ncbi:MAG: XRE family transcriptional regulator [Deltaproteobacteria bacterium]|nr:XRE family transcriptional regulator [Deltaproteobacteria bacterium]